MKGSLIFGNEKLINPLIKKYKINSDKYKIIHTEKIIEDTDTALGAAKKVKDTSLWLAMESLKNRDKDLALATASQEVCTKLYSGCAGGWLSRATRPDTPA